MNIEIVDYNEKSILIKGDTKPLKEKLKELGGRYNPTLGGWIFSKKKKEEIQKSLASFNNDKIKNVQVNNNKIENKIENVQVNNNKIENKIENKIDNNTNVNPTVDNIISIINDMFSEMNYEERLKFVLMITNLACNNS